jgi:hypothetical protein
MARKFAAHKTRPDNIAAQEKCLDALGLRKAGLSYAAIGKEIGVCRQRAYQLVVEAMDAMRAECAEEAEAVRVIELERLDALWVGNYPAAVSGDSSAINSALKIMERRARLLGLDAPTKVAPTTPDGEAAYNLPSISDAELIRWAQEHGITVSYETDSGTVESE